MRVFISGYIRIPNPFEYATCGREPFRIRKKTFAEKKNFQIRVDMASLLIFDVLLNIYILSVVAAVNSYKVYGYLSCFA